MSKEAVAPSRIGSSHGQPRPGRVVAGYGRRVLIEDPDGTRHRCLVARRRLRVVCGDRVAWCPPDGHGDGLVFERFRRNNALARPDRRGRSEAIAANITQLVVVAAPLPMPNPFLVDRYLASAELMAASACVVWNKTDRIPYLPAPRSAGSGADHPPDLDLEEFRRVGYAVCSVSARTGSGLDALRDLLVGHASILVGQSGVGKSSLLNALIPNVDAATAEISAATGEGRHTTTASVLHHLPGGGELLDSPGVRDYAPPPIPRDQVARGYREFAAHVERCRFSNCMHMREPDCAVKNAVEAGEVSARRYESYRRLVRLVRNLAERQGTPAGR